MIQETKKTNRILPNVIITIVGLFLVVVVVKGWSEPAVAPPGNNIAVPINIGANAQTKIGGIGTLGGMVANSAQFGSITLGGVTRNSWPTFPGETDPTVPASVKDGTSWGEVSGKPSLRFVVYEKSCQNCFGTIFCCNSYPNHQMVSGGFEGSGPYDCPGGKGWRCGNNKPGAICYMRCGYVEN